MIPVSDFEEIFTMPSIQDWGSWWVNIIWKLDISKAHGFDHISVQIWSSYVMIPLLKRYLYFRTALNLMIFLKVGKNIPIQKKSDKQLILACLTPAICSKIFERTF